MRGFTPGKHSFEDYGGALSLEVDVAVLGAGAGGAAAAYALAQAGHADLALATIAEALATSSAKADHHLDAELHRLQGEALLLQSPANAPQAAQCFQTALCISQQQHAKVFELRAATSLARLWKKKRKGAAAHTLLSGVYGAWREGLDTPDLCDARHLLERL